MEHVISAPCAGKLSSIHCELNDVVEDSAILAVVDDNAD